MKKRHVPTIIAHRGLHHTHPENSLGAFRAAWESGIDWCECDVQIRDRLAGIILHDDTLDRTTELSGLLEEHLRWDVIKARLRLADGTLTDEHVPEIRDVSSVIQAYLFGKPLRRKYMLFEIKSPCDPNIPLGVLESLLHVQSFDIRILMSIRQRRRHASCYLLIEDRDLIGRNLAAPWVGLNIRHDLLDFAIIETIQSQGKKVGAWTPNSERELRVVVEMGVDMVITDEPLLARDVIQEICM